MCSLLCRTIIRRAICERGAIREVNQALGRMNIKGVPARTSPSKFSTTSPSNWNTCCPRVKESLVSPMTFSEGSVSLMGGLGILTNLNFQLLNSGQVNHVTSDPPVDGNTDRVVTIKRVQVGRLAYLDSQCTGVGLVSSRRRLVVLWFFLRIRPITIENTHDLPNFCNELSIDVREISALA